VDSLEILNQRGLSYIVSYDGKLGERVYGQALPERLELEKLELDAGRSSTATLLGRDDVTIESLYLSKPLTKRLMKSSRKLAGNHQAASLALFPFSYEAETFEAVP
jgi:DNA adenine methylase